MEFLELYNDWMKTFFTASAILNAARTSKRDKKYKPDDFVPDDWKKRYKEIMQKQGIIMDTEQKKHLMNVLESKAKEGV